MLHSRFLLIASIFLFISIQETLQECTLTKNHQLDEDVLKCSATSLQDIVRFYQTHEISMHAYQIKEIYLDTIKLNDKDVNRWSQSERKNLEIVVSKLRNEHPILILSWIKSNLTDELIQNLLSDNETTYISTNTTTIKRAKKYINLRELDLSKNHLIELRRTYFRNVNNLKTLRLTSNSITILHADTFMELSNLRELYLNGNYLRNLSLNLFANLHELLKLDLSNASLIDLPRTVFEGLHNLKELYLASNRLYVLPFQVFRELKVRS